MGLRCPHDTVLFLRCNLSAYPANMPTVCNSRPQVCIQKHAAIMTYTCSSVRVYVGISASPLGICITLYFCPLLFYLRARQKHIIKETVTPGESKASKPPKVVHRRGTSLIVCPLPHRLRLERQSLSQTVSRSKLVSFCCRKKKKKRKLNRVPYVQSCFVEK